MLCCCIDMRLADDRREHLPAFNESPYSHSMSLPPSGVAPTTIARVLGKLQKLLDGEFRVSPRYLLCGVSLPGGGTGGVGVDERVEGASRRPTGFVLLDVDQVEQATQICPLVEARGSVASFDNLNQASDEVEAERTVIPLAVSSVDLQGNWLVHAFFSSARGSGQEGGWKPQPNPRAVTETLTFRAVATVKYWRTLR